MYYPNKRHRVFFNGVDLEQSYKMITSEKPIVSPPEAKTEFVEILGADGLLDLTEGVDGVPRFNNRELVLKFIVRPGVDVAWVMHNLTTHYHNRRVAIRLPDDDPQYIYTGRIKLDPVEHDGYYHRITMTVNIDFTGAYNMDDEYIQVPTPGGDDYMVDVPSPGVEGEYWVKVPSPGGDDYMIDVPSPGASDYWIRVDDVINVPSPGVNDDEMIPVP